MGIYQKKYLLQESAYVFIHCLSVFKIIRLFILQHGILLAVVTLSFTRWVFMHPILSTMYHFFLKPFSFFVHIIYQRGIKTIHPVFGRPWVQYSRASQTKDFKLVVEASLSNARHMKGSLTQKLVDPLPE